MHILICPNAFKNSLDADAAAAAIEHGLEQSSLSCTTQCFPVGDGGDGTGTLLTRLCHGTLVLETVSDPLGRKINAGYGLIENGRTAVIEMAAASGLHLLKNAELDPLHALSSGTGELISRALDKGVKKILLCVGGTATIDGGSGILQALGVRFLDSAGNELQNMPASLTQLVHLDISKMDARARACDWTVLCDVRNPLLGTKGAANVFGPQKGASPEQVHQLEAALTQLNKVIMLTLGKDMGDMPYCGAAGGTAAGMHAVMKANLVNGIETFLDLTGFEEALRNADMIITGEGRIDLQTLEGKAPFGVAVRAQKNNIPVIGLAGSIPSTQETLLNKYFNVLVAIGNEPMNIENAMATTKQNLVRCACSVGDLLALTMLPKI